MKITPGDFRIKMSIQSVERDVDRLHTYAAQSCRHGLSGRGFAREQRPVRRNSETANSWDFRNFADEIDDVAASKRFATSNAHFGYTQTGRDPNQTQGLFVAKNILARQPFLQLTWHAIIAALVAAIGDRDAEIGNAVAVAIFHFRTQR